jgi:uncharacterized protein (TIGR03437 family)
MLKRVSALCAFGVALSAVLLQAQDLFVLPGAGAASGTVQAFTANPLNTFRTFDAGTGSFALLPNLDASKFFVVATSSSNSIIGMDRTLLTPTLVANLPLPANQAFVTPDGRLLVVSAGTIHLFSTASNGELVAGGVSQGNGVNTFSMAPSLDSTAIFALGSSASGGSQLSSISTSTFAVTGTLPFAQVATAVSVGPNGLVYVSLPNQIIEVDPRTLTATFNGTISVSGTPGPLVFTPDGQYGIGVNQSSFGNTLLIASLVTHTSTSPSLGVTGVTSLQLIGTDTVLALSSQGLYQITISPSINAVPISIPSSAGGLVAITLTNDVPVGANSTVQSVYFVSPNTLYQYSPASRSVTNQFSVAVNVVPGALAYAAPASSLSQSHATTLLAYGNNQTILPNATSEPLVVQVLDANNLPLSGATVQFQSNANNATLSATSAITGSNGYALTYLTSSGTAATVTVTASTGGLTTNFTVDVSATAHGGGPTLTILSGQGQLMAVDTSTAGGLAFGSPLQVLATDVNGNPIVGLPVTFSVPSTDGTIQVNGSGASSQTVATNTAGVASVDFQTTLVPSNNTQGFLQSLVSATAANTNSVTFYITAVNLGQTTVYFQAPAPNTTVIGAEGSTLAGAVKAQVVSPSGKGIPNVLLAVDDQNANPSLYPSVECNAPSGPVFTDANGIATCDLTFGPRLGAGSFVETIGSTRTSFSYPFVVTAGAPGAVQITQGNNQTGIPGQKLPLALVVRVTDSGGNTVVGGSVNWKVITSGTVTLSNVVSVTDSNGNASALATLGSTGGVAQVMVTAGSASATFNLTVNIPIAGIQKVSGDQQTALINGAFALPLTVKVADSSGNGLASAQVNFQVASGAATLGSSGAITDSTGQASTTVTAGATAGAITVTATSSSFSVSFSLTAKLPGPSNLTIVNGASFDPNTGISPGGIATITGMGILPGVQGLVLAANSAGVLPTTFDGVTVSFNGTPAPIYYVQSTNGTDQVSVQVPFEVQAGAAVALAVNVANSGSGSVTVPVKPLAPGVFTSIYAGKTYAVAVRPDGTQVSPTNPAQRGENINLYVTGLGQAVPVIATGKPGVPNQSMGASLIVGLNNGGVPLISAVYGPGLIGVYVVTLHVPLDTQTGPYQPIGVIAYDSANNAYFAQPTYIPIQ